MKNKQVLGSRHLFNARLLGLDDYQYYQNKFRMKYEVNRESFINKMSRKHGRNIRSHDLFRILHLAESDSDVELCIHMTKRYLNTPFNFKMNESDIDLGPLILRMLHHLKKPDIAIKVVEDKDFADICRHYSVDLIYMDLLYESGKYEKLVEFFFEEVQKESEKKGKQNSNHAALCMAALYKINTKDALEKAVDYLFKQYHQEQSLLSHRTKAFAAVLAANQNEPELALEIIDMEYESTWVGNFNTVLRMQFLARLNRLREALKILEDFLHYKHEAKTLKGVSRVFPDSVGLFTL